MTYVVALIGVAVILLAVVAWKMRKRGLSSADKAALRKAWERAASQRDPHRRVMDADAVVCDLLGRLGYAGSMGDRLKKTGPRLKNLQGVWDAHKLRNRIAHEPGYDASPSDVARALSSLESVLRQFL